MKHSNLTFFHNFQYNRSRERYDAQQRHSPTAVLETNSEMEAARPQTVGEEELQLQLALAMSREEAEQEETKSKSDDMRLQLALQKSKEDTVKEYVYEGHANAAKTA